jgi:5'-AMP-activated protein kinase regulatory gamma subunit
MMRRALCGCPSASSSVPQLLHLTNLAEVLACLVRHFRGVPSALPLFSQPIGALPLGTWTQALGGFRGQAAAAGVGADSSGASSSAAAAAAAGDTPVPALLPLKALLPNTTVSDAFKMMPGVRLRRYHSLYHRKHSEPPSLELRDIL